VYYYHYYFVALEEVVDSLDAEELKMYQVFDLLFDLQLGVEA